MAEVENKTASSKLSAFLEKNKKALLCCLAVIVLALIAYIVVDACGKKANEKGLAAVDEISYALTKDSLGLSDDEIESRRVAAMDALVPYTKKNNVVGVRANMICAELEYQLENYENALNYWKATANAGKKSYTAPIAYYNIGSCYEALNDIDSAAEYYKKAVDSKDFVLKAHAQFSYGRVLEAKGDYAGAVAVYTELNDATPDDTWAKLAKTRILKLQIEGKAE